ncbi:hypothetical protein M4A02_06215 [Rothia kristinae]|uniref:hypothetical protein n=1 Tax=Rothia kristinae TaxID=37923 RepID=UPI0021A44157|nr:hypothetical protein [Rothia kristinae]MCT1506108.1 hypothetical protein [Rothia kristinae]
MGDARGLLGTEEHGVGQLRGGQQPAAHGEVGPDAILHAGNDHDGPFASGRGGWGQQAHGRARAADRREGVHGQVLAVQVVQELLDAGPGLLLGEALRGFEQLDHRVQVPVSPLGRRAAAAGGLLPGLRQAAGLPQGPQHVLRRNVRLGHRGPARGQHRADPAQPGGAGAAAGQIGALLPVGGGLSPVDLAQGGQQQLVPGAPSPGPQLAGAQGLTQPTQPGGAGAAQSGGEQVQGARPGLLLPVGEDPQGVQEGPHGRFLAQRGLRHRHGRGDAVGVQVPLDPRERGAVAHDHGHLLQPPAAQHVLLQDQLGQQPQLLLLGAHEQHLGGVVALSRHSPPLVHGSFRSHVIGLPLGGFGGLGGGALGQGSGDHGDPVGDPLEGRDQARGHPVTGGEADATQAVQGG